MAGELKHVPQRVWTAINLLTRQRVTELLENIGVACYDDELMEDLREALAVNVVEGNIDEALLDDGY